MRLHKEQKDYSKMLDLFLNIVLEEDLSALIKLRAYKLVADHYFAIHNLEYAFKFYTEAEKIYHKEAAFECTEKLEIVLGLADCLLVLKSKEINAKEINDVLFLYAEAQSLSDSMNKQNNERIIRGIINCYLLIQQPEEAIFLCNSHEFLNHKENSFIRSELLILIGDYYNNSKIKNNINQAIILYDQAIGDTSKEKLHDIYNKIANCYLALGKDNVKKALEYYTLSYQHLPLNNESQGVLANELLSNIAACYNYLQLPLNAAKYYERLLQNLSSNELQEISKIYYELGKPRCLKRL